LARLGALLLAGFAGVAAAVERGEPAPDFALPDAEGRIVRLAELRGRQPIYVDFWASWCAPCRKSFPWMGDLQVRHPGLRVIAVNLDEQRDDAARFLATVPARFTVVYDPSARTARDWRVAGMPSSFLVDRNGVVRLVHKGFRSEDGERLDAEIQRLLGGKP
jgi:thiol-disulfide isomerase/thioredoxin